MALMLDCMRLIVEMMLTEEEFQCPSDVGIFHLVVLCWELISPWQGLLD